MIQLGKILKPHGIKGELKLGIVPGYKDCFDTIKTVLVADRSYDVERCRIDKCVYIKLKGVDTRTQAEVLHDCPIYVSQLELPPLQEHEYYYSDIIGSQVYLDNQYLGQLVDIGQYGSADVHTVKTCDGNVVRYPFLKRLIVDIDIISKKIIYDSNQFGSVCVYD
ncbi:MAG: ribosome maturation factor RimM [Clostridiales bacterium]|jgi:16S rRNA processing protein RimM|nr:ribosome maturation factor RimM [Clostridiales bacterium]